MQRQSRIAIFLMGAALARGLGQTPVEDRVRARDLGVPFEGTPGRLNAITDVPGVEVGATTLIRGDGALKVGEGPVRTGVTVVFPRGKHSSNNVYAGWFSLNGNGEMTGTTWLEEAGLRLQTRTAWEWCAIR
jgi:D-aminopeptidase